jgi:Calx-beta domain
MIDYYKLRVNDEYVEEGHVAHVKVELNKQNSQDIKVYYQTHDGSAHDGDDYYGKNDGEVTIPAWKGWETIDIQTKDDYDKEGKEDFYVKVWTKDEDGGGPTPTITATSTKSDGGYKVEVKDDNARVEITDNDGHDNGKAKVYVSNAHAKEGEPLKFDFWQDGHQPVHVQYYTEKWEANAGGDNDYKPTSGDFWLQPGEHKEADVETYHDKDYEGAERMKMWVVNTNGYDRGNEHPDHGTGTIYDKYDDGGGTPTPTATLEAWQ